MSHFSKVTTQIKDIAALERAVAELGLTMTSHQKVRGYTDINAEHVIKLNGQYDVGLELNEDMTFRLVYDPYQGHVENELGPGCGRLLQRYAVCKLEVEARKKGLSVFRNYQQNGNIQVVLQQVGVYA